jgi:hypothetical protein
MALLDVVRTLRQWHRWLPARARRSAVGETEVADARRLADAERRLAGVPDGCAWLDERTMEGLDLGLVFRAIDRTVTPTGAQVLWRWLAAPAVRIGVLAGRERALARLAAQPGLRDRVRAALHGQATSDAAYLPRLLWESSPQPLRVGAFAALAALLVSLAVLGVWWPMMWIGAVVVFVVNILLDDWVSARFAAHSYGLRVLDRALGSAERLAVRGVWDDAEIARELAPLAAIRQRVAWLTTSDPFGLFDLLRGGLLLRLLLLGGSMRTIERERERLRRVVLWLGELDALVSVATLRAERRDARVPMLSGGAGGAGGAWAIRARAIVHPAIDGAVGNDVALDPALIVTGSNMSGKSTFLRAVAINAICAQSIHTTFGSWTAPLVRVFSVMRVLDAIADDMSTYAVEVAAVGTLVDAAARRDHDVPALFVIDEPFSGTNPVLRVPIVVSVLEYLSQRDLVVAATHDLDVAAQLDARFARGYFFESDDGAAQFDYKLRPGVSPASNAVALLVRAGYPPDIVAAIERRAGREIEG